MEPEILLREISEILWRTGKTVSTAESCTAGLVAAALSSVPGASAYLQGGLIVYSNTMKTKLLGVSEALLAEHGAVSEACARAMVGGALERLGTDYAVAVTGYAGPGGGPEAQVGTIFVAVGRQGDIRVRQLSGDDGRAENVAHATSAALHLLLETLKNDFPQAEE